ncbi:MAG: Ig domain-containing protein, partial [Lachnospiraceae bacterium]|nr:Ig domain-containing protein [Lachnospiraceae bacterium]
HVHLYFRKTLAEEPKIMGGASIAPGESYASARTFTYNILDSYLSRYGEGYYSIKVQGLSNDPEKVQLSEESAMSDPLFVGSDTAATKDNLAEIVNGISSSASDSEKQAALADVKEIGVQKLRESMVLDTANAGANSLIQELESKLNVPVEKVIDAVSGIDVESADDIRVIGAGLNAQDLSAGVKFNMGKPAKEVVVPGAYHSAIQVDFSLEGADYQGEKLAVPVKIVIPVPTDIEPSLLRILHYHSSTDNYDEVINPYVFQENGKWYASFVVDSFSAFVFGGIDEEKAAEEKLLLAVGQKLDVSAMLPTKYEKYGVSASPKGAAAVSSKGIVTGKKAGTAKVFGYIKDGKKWVADDANGLDITVEKPVIVSKTVLLAKLGQTASGAENFSGTSLAPASWSSAKPKVAAVDPSSGEITALANGSAKITAFFGEGKNAAKYSYTVKVLIPSISKKAASMQTGATLKLTVKNTKLPVTWKSSAEELATVEGGKVTALSAGTVNIIAEVDGVEYPAEITVIPPVIKKKNLTVKVGKSASVGLKSTKLKNILWTSSDESVATVDSKGKVTGVSAGTAVISTMTGGVENSCTVEVK